MRLVFILILVMAGVELCGQTISADRLRAHVKFLSSDLLEGRAPGTRGGQLTTEYLAAQFALAGAEPAARSDSYLQPVPLVAIETQPSATLSVAGERLEWQRDFAGVSERPNELVEFSGDAVFAGYGISDHGDLDVTGKVVIVLRNDSPSEPTVHARDRGATAVLFVDAGPPQPGKETLQLRRPDGKPALAFRGSLSQAAASRLFELAGRSLAALTQEAGAPGFQAVPLGLRVDGRIPSHLRPVTSHNVVAIVKGRDAESLSEVVIYSAHWDQLGVGAKVDGDGIYNGALDNATGTAVLLELARAWASLKTRPKRSALFLAVTAGEAGLLGSEYYTGHPAAPLGKTAVAINLDTFQPLGIPESLNLGGVEDTSVWQQVQDAGRRLGLKIQASKGPGIGTCCQSDHYPFARAGVPAFSIRMAGGFAGKDGAWLEALRVKNDYDRPSDEYRDEWDFSGLALVGEYGFLAGRMIAELDDLPSWNKDSPFYRPR